MDGSEGPADTGRHGLGPHVVGRRVVVRRLLRGETGPSGGPAMTDVLGTCTGWAAGLVTVEREDGTTVTIRTADIVSGKPVPPRPSRFARLSDEYVAERAAGLFVPRETKRIGGWRLRYTGGMRARANSVLPLGDPGLPLDEALTAVARFYADRDRAPWIEVVTGSDLHRELEARGWDQARPLEADAEVLLAGVAQVARRVADVPAAEVRHEDVVTRAWLVGNDATLANWAAVEASLRLRDAVFSSVVEDGRQVARARANLAGDWALVADLTVQPDARRRGLGRLVMADLVRWAAERGAETMLLQVIADNEPAQQLYAGLGFERHHACRYLTPTTSPAG